MSKHDRALCFMIGAVGDKKTATSGTTAALFSFLKATVFLYKRWPKDFYDTHLDNTDNFLKRQARCLDIWANVDLCNSCDTAWLVLNVLNVQVIGKRYHGGEKILWKGQHWPIGGGYPNPNKVISQVTGTCPAGTRTEHMWLMQNKMENALF